MPLHCRPLDSHMLSLIHTLRPSLDSSIFSGLPPAASLHCSILLNGGHEPSPGTPCRLSTPSNLISNTKYTSDCPSFSPQDITGSSVLLICEMKKKVRAGVSKWIQVQPAMHKLCHSADSLWTPRMATVSSACHDCC